MKTFTFIVYSGLCLVALLFVWLFLENEKRKQNETKPRNYILYYWSLSKGLRCSDSFKHGFIRNKMKIIYGVNFPLHLETAI